MKFLIAADIISNKIHVNNLYNLDFNGEIVIEYSNVVIYKNDIELIKNSENILWYSPSIKMIDASKINVILKDKNGNTFFSTVPTVYTGTFMRTGNSELNNLCDFIKNSGCIPNTIVEIGSFQGESTTIFSQNFVDSKIFAVDIWSNNYEMDINANNPKDVENNFDFLTRDYNNIIKIKMSSENFSNVIADKSVDFIYIDGDHSYNGVNTDIIKWRNKVKNGGYIGGHDYVEDRVDLIRAIKENFPNDVINIFGWSWLIKIEDKKSKMNNVIIDHKDGKFLLFPQDFISKVMMGLKSDYSDLTHEPHFREIIKLINDEDVVIDGGANLGYNSVLMAKKCSRGKVFSFEPQRIIFQQLNTNIMLNNIYNANTYNLAIAEISGKNLQMMPINYELDDINIGGYSIGYGGEEVKTIKIDDLNLSRLDFIKLDVQGYEIFAIEGGIETIKKYKPYIFVEIENDQLIKFGKSPDDLVSLIKSLGYQIYKINLDFPLGAKYDHICTINNIDKVEKLNLPLIKI